MTVGGLYSASAKCGQAILRDELALASQVFVSSAPLGGPERLQVLRGLSAGPCSSILGRGEASCRQNVGSQAADSASRIKMVARLPHGPRTRADVTRVTRKVSRAQRLSAACALHSDHRSVERTTALSG